MPERRTAVRIPLNAEVNLRREGATASARGSVTNINLQGICIACEERFQVGEVVDLWVVAHEDLEKGTGGPLTAKLRIVRVLGDEAPFEIAGELEDLNLP